MSNYDKQNAPINGGADNTKRFHGGDGGRSDRAPKERKFESPRIFVPATSFAPIAKSASVPKIIPAVGERVFTRDSSEAFTLTAPIMTDHSSITYKTDNGEFFAKIYTLNALSIDIFENKAKRMVKENVNIKGVCWPRALLINTYGEFVGILVPASSGVQLSKSILSGTAAINQFFPTWDKRDLCTASHTILDTICKAQKLGIRFGCFNPASVYIASPTEVYFVDTDCWQIEGYPTLSRNITFTPPELLSEQQKPRLFNKDEENYQIALLTFMLMMPGKYPYAKKKRSDSYENIKDMSFPFSVGGESRRSQDAEKPSGAWQIVWDHLPFKMCSNFYHTFHASGNFSKPGTRLRDYEWVNAVDEFARHLSFDKNAESRALTPRTFRRDEKREFAKCSICNQEHPVFYFLRNIKIQNERINVWDRGYRICLPCAVDQSNASFTCKSCNKTFYYTNQTKIIHEIGRLSFDWNGQKWCHTCKKHTVKCVRCQNDVPLYQIQEYTDRKRNLKKNVCKNCFHELLNEHNAEKNEVYTRAACRQCYEWFVITKGEAEFFQAKGMNLPSRCPSCRGRK